MYVVSSSGVGAQLLIDYIDDYNSWQENFLGRWKRRRLDKDVILAEGTYV